MAFAETKTRSGLKVKVVSVARNDWSVRQSSQLAIEKGVCPLVGECCSLSVVMRPTMPREGMILTRIAVDCRVWFPGKCRLNLSLRSLGNELVLLGQVHQQRRIKPIDLSQIFLSVTAVISDRSVDAVSARLSERPSARRGNSRGRRPCRCTPAAWRTALTVSLTSLAPASRS